MVQVVADPGLGKSAFAAAVAQEASAHAVHRAVCGQFGGAMGYNAVRRLLRDVLGLDGGSPKDVQVEALRALVTDRCPELSPYFPLLTVVLDAAVPDTPETRDLGERFRAAKLVEVVVAFLHVVLDKPTVLVFEDVDEMDDSSAAIVTAMAEIVGERPWLLVVTRSRGTTGLRLPEEVAVEEVELQPFDHAESVALLESWTVERAGQPAPGRGDRAEGRRQPALHGGAARRGPRARDGRRPARLAGSGRHRRDRPAHPS